MIKDLKVSSYFERDVVNFNKWHLIDGNLETCWSSDCRKNQFIMILMEEQLITEISILFQGGYSASCCLIKSNHFEQRIYPINSNKPQTFLLELKTDSITFVFEETFDPYGRIIIYQIEIK